MDAETLIAVGAILTALSGFATAVWTNQHAANKQTVEDLVKLVDQLQEENKRLLERVSALEADNSRLRQRVVELENENMTLHEQIASLKARKPGR